MKVTHNITINGELELTYDLGNGGVLLADGQTWVPRSFTFSGSPPAAGDGVRVIVDVVIDPRWGQPRCTNVEFVAREDAGLTTEALRIPLKALLDSAVVAAGQTLKKDLEHQGAGVQFHPPSKDERVAAADQVRSWLASGSRVLDDAHYKQVATHYRAGQDYGKPTTSVEREMGCSYSTAARWVGEARKRGFLEPVAQK